MNPDQAESSNNSQPDPKTLNPKYPYITSIEHLYIPFKRTPNFEKPPSPNTNPQGPGVVLDIIQVDEIKHCYSPGHCLEGPGGLVSGLMEKKMEADILFRVSGSGSVGPSKWGDDWG